MLTVAVGLTLIGFGLLVFALIQANLALAIACIAVCVIGLIVLLVDTVRASNRAGSSSNDEPLFTIRDDTADAAEPAAAAPSVLDAAAPPVEVPAVPAPEATAVLDATEIPSEWAAPAVPAATEVSPDGLGSLVSAEPFTAPTAAVDAPTTLPEPAAGDANDYIRSVTGSFPAVTPEPYGTPEPHVAPEPFVAPESAVAPDPFVAPAPYAAAEPYVAEPAAPQSFPPPVPFSQEYVHEPTSPQSPQPLYAPVPPVDPAAAESVASGPIIRDAAVAQSDTAAEPAPVATETGYVGRRRRAEGESDALVVRSSDPALPAMKLVYGDHPEDT